MNPLTVLLIGITVVLALLVFFIPMIMSVLDPHNIPANLANYYRSKKLKVTLVVGVIVLIIVSVIWLYAFKFGLVG